VVNTFHSKSVVHHYGKQYIDNDEAYDLQKV